MKKAKNKVLIAALGAAVIGTLGVAGLLTVHNTGNTAAYADTTVEETEQFQIVKDVENIVATYSFTILSETECSVKITNKSVATKAIIPSTAEIGGKTYKVTEIAANGFSSSSKLIRVSFPSTLKKVGNNAFASCGKLKSINLANVKEIGNGAFSRCPELADILMPLSVEKVGTYVFRNNNTKVRIRAKEAECAAWATTWNNYNNNQEQEYESHYIQPMVLEEIYDTMARTANPEVIGYAVAGGQPLSEKYQPEAVNYGIQTFADIDDGTITPDNRDLSPRTMQNVNRCIRKEISEEFDFHSLRKTHATMLAELGVNQKYIQTRLGHTNLEMTFDVYECTTDLMRQQGREVLNTIYT